MEFLQRLLDSGTTPAMTALILGLLTAISPCPLATNIAAIGYVSKDIEDRRSVFYRGVLYTLGRVVAYTVLGVIIISILREGASAFGIQKNVSKWGELLIGPILVLVGAFMLFGHRLNLPKFGFKGNGEKMASRGGWGALWLGVLFALAFCPSSAVFYFGMLIPMSVESQAGFMYPVLYAVATALPVLAVAWILAFSVQSLSKVYGRIQTVQRWANIVIGILFLSVGVYYMSMIYL